jgi:hypothetical protein
VSEPTEERVPETAASRVYAGIPGSTFTTWAAADEATSVRARAKRRIIENLPASRTPPESV